MSAPPDVIALAAAGLAALDGPGQALAACEDGAPRLELTAVVDGRAGTATADADDDEGLARAARRAALRARQLRGLPAPPLPTPAGTAAAPDPTPPGGPARAGTAPGRDGIDAAGPAPGEPAADGVAVWSTTGAADLAVASSTGVRAAERRRWLAVVADATTADGRRATVRAWSAPADGGPDAAAELAAHTAADVRALLGHGLALGPLVAAVPAVRAGVGAARPRVVLGPEAVAILLDAVRSRFGVDAALGVDAGRFAAGLVELDDDAGHPLTLPRTFDVEGTPRRRVALAREGRPVGAVGDAAAAARADTATAATGHATRPLTLAPLAQHLVLGAGDAPDVAALCGAIGDGVYLPTLVRGADGLDAPGAAWVEAGRPAGALTGLRVEVDAAAVLRAAVGLTAARRVVALPGHGPGGVGAAVVGALAATDGVAVVRADRP